MLTRYGRKFFHRQNAYDTRVRMLGELLKLRECEPLTDPFVLKAAITPIDSSAPADVKLMTNMPEQGITHDEPGYDMDLPAYPKQFMLVPITYSGSPIYFITRFRHERDVLAALTRFGGDKSCHSGAVRKIEKIESPIDDEDSRMPKECEPEIHILPLTKHVTHPDVFIVEKEQMDGKAEKIMDQTISNLLLVTSLEMSAKLRQLFKVTEADDNGSKARNIPCIFDAKFGKWTLAM